MTRFVIQVVVTALAVLLAGSLAWSGVTLGNNRIEAALAFAVVLGLLNAFVRPVLQLLTLPLTLITLGLFTLVLNAFVFWLAALLRVGVDVDGFRGAFMGALIVSVLSFVASRIR